MSGDVFLHRLRVPFGDIDQAQVLYFPRLFHYCHLTMEAFFDGPMQLPYHRFLKERGLGLPTVHAEADYAATIPYGTDLEAGLTVRKIGRTSLDLRFRFGSASADASARVHHAEARNTVVCVGLPGFSPTPLPEDLRGVLARYVEGAS